MCTSLFYGNPPPTISLMAISITKRANNKRCHHHHIRLIFTHPNHRTNSKKTEEQATKNKQAYLAVHSDDHKLRM